MGHNSRLARKGLDMLTQRTTTTGLKIVDPTGEVVLEIVKRRQKTKTSKFADTLKRRDAQLRAFQVANHKVLMRYWGTQCDW